MKIQILASIMNETKNSLNDIVKKMNIKSDAIIVNQCERNDIEEIILDNKYKVKMLSFNERGVGLSRNTALMRADSDVVVFADNDVQYNDNYKEIIQKAFKEMPNADMIAFVLPKIEDKRNENSKIKSKLSRVLQTNCLKYGTYRFAIKLESLKKANIYFSLLFGGGTRFGSGEDSIFITECIRKGLKVYSSNQIIGYLLPNKSTWFNGYNEKFFIDSSILLSFSIII